MVNIVAIPIQQSARICETSIKTVEMDFAHKNLLCIKMQLGIMIYEYIWIKMDFQPSLFVLVWFSSVGPVVVNTGKFHSSCTGQHRQQ